MPRKMSNPALTPPTSDASRGLRSGRRAFLIGLGVWGLLVIAGLKLGATTDAPIDIIAEIPKIQF